MFTLDIPKCASWPSLGGCDNVWKNNANQHGHGDQWLAELPVVKPIFNPIL